jgi:hypothetical protein
MTFRSAAACVALLLLPMTALAQPLLIEGADSRREVDCGGRDVEITGFGHRVTGSLPGNTEKPATVEVTGEGSVLDLELNGPTRIVVAGARHKVLWSAAPGLPAPQRDIRGIGNVVERAPRS